MVQETIENKESGHWVTVMMPVSSIVKGQRLLIAVTVALFLRNGLHNPDHCLHLGL